MFATDISESNISCLYTDCCAETRKHKRDGYVEDIGRQWYSEKTVRVEADGIPQYTHTSVLLDLSQGAYLIKYLETNKTEIPIIPIVKSADIFLAQTKLSYRLWDCSSNNAYECELNVKKAIRLRRTKYVFYFDYVSL